MAEQEQSAFPEDSRSIDPVVLAMVVCDWIYVDPLTGKKNLMGTFSVITGVQFPLVLPQLCLYVAVTNGHGKTPWEIRLVDVNEEHPLLFQTSGDFQFDDPRVVLEVASVAGNLVFPAPGEYRFQFLTSGTLLLERRLLVQNISVEPT